MSQPGSRLSFVVVTAVAGLCTACGSGEESDSGTPPSGTVFVDEAAAPGGDGSFEHPFQSVREALELDRPFEVVAVAGGRYPAPPDWQFTSSLTILAHTEAPTVLQAEAPDEALSWHSSDLLVLRDLVLGSPLLFEGGEVELRQVEVEAVMAPALTLTASDARVFGLDIGEVVGPADQPNQGDGVVVDGGSLQLTGGQVVGVPDRALVLKGAQATLSNVALQSGSRAPLTVIEGSDVTATGVVIEDVSIGVFVDAATLRMEQAQVRRAGTAGVLASPESTTQISDSVFEDCPNGHVSVLGVGSSLTLERNTLRGATQASCVFASNTDGSVVLRDNTLSRCAGSGISLVEVVDAVVEGNDVSDILPDPIFPDIADGISVLDASATLSGNRIYDTLGYGVALNRASVTAENNEIGPTGEAGITIVGAGTAASTIRGNTIDQAGGAGVIALETTAEVLNNTITATLFNPGDNFGDGVAFGMNATVTVRGNTISGCDRNGIVFLDGASGSIDANQATGNAEYGILELCTGAANAVTIGSNVLDGNTLGASNLCSP